VTHSAGLYKCCERAFEGRGDLRPDVIVACRTLVAVRLGEVPLMQDGAAREHARVVHDRTASVGVTWMWHVHCLADCVPRDVCAACRAAEQRACDPKLRRWSSRPIMCARGAAFELVFTRLCTGRVDLTLLAVYDERC
jgi:hypothetical protein